MLLRINFKLVHPSINLRRITIWISMVHLKETVVNIQLGHWLQKIFPK